MIFIILILIIVFIIDIVPLFKEKKKKDFILCAMLFVISLTIITLMNAGVKVPSPMLALHKLFKSLGLAYKS